MKRIRNLRGNKSLSQNKVVEILNYSQTTDSRQKTENLNISVAFLIKVTICINDLNGLADEKSIIKNPVD